MLAAGVARGGAPRARGRRVETARKALGFEELLAGRRGDEAAHAQLRRAS
jgi:hypothetical protein